MTGKYQAGMTEEQEERVQRLHQESFIFNALTFSTLDHEYAVILKSVGVNATNYTVAATTLTGGQVIQDNFVTACNRIGHWYRILDECRDVAALATSLQEMYEIQKSDRIAIFFGFQNGSPIEENLDYLDIFHRLGVRFVQLTYNARNFIGNGCGEKDSGLSQFGSRAVKRMNELGMVVDLSHCGDQTTLDAIEVSEKPVLFTHANVRSLANTPRNKTDDQIRLLAQKGGVMGVKSMLGDTITKAARDTTVADLVDHIDYIANLVGIEHVAIGTDFAGTTSTSERTGINEMVQVIRSQFSGTYLGERSAPLGIRSIEDLPNITRELVRRGYTDADIKKVLGENWIRVLGTILGQ